MQLYHSLICACMNFSRFFGWLVSLKERWKRLNPEIQLTSNFRHASVSSLLFTPPCLLYLYLACIWFAPVFDLYLFLVFVFVNQGSNWQATSVWQVSLPLFTFYRLICLVLLLSYFVILCNTFVLLGPAFVIRCHAYRFNSRISTFYKFIHLD